ncbi:MAG: FAD-dependent monooxygenase [Pseudomonadota bacterium]
MKETTDQIETDVLIVGAGLTGSTLALALADKALDVTMIERGTPVLAPKPNKPIADGAALSGVASGRVMSLNCQSIRALEGVGIPRESYAHYPFHRIHAVDGCGSGGFAVDASDIGLDTLGSIVHAEAPLAVMQARLQENPSCTMRFGTEITSMEDATDHCGVVLKDGSSLRTKLVVAADGGQSSVRASAGIRQLGWTYPQEAVVCNALCSRSHRGEASQVFLETGPVALLPLSNGDQSLVSVVWSHTDANKLSELSDVEFCTALTEATEGRCGEIKAVTQRGSFPLLQHQAMGYVRRHLVLLGDAAHTIHPLAGQGANLGIGDALALAEELSRCRYSGESPGDLGLLRTYERRRLPINVGMAAVMEGFYRLFGNSHPLPLWLRSRGMSALGGMSVFKTLIGQLATGTFAIERSGLGELMTDTNRREYDV